MSGLLLLLWPFFHRFPFPFFCLLTNFCWIFLDPISICLVSLVYQKQNIVNILTRVSPFYRKFIDTWTTSPMHFQRYTYRRYNMHRQLTFYVFLVIKIYIISLLYLNYEDNQGGIYYANVWLFHLFNLRLDKFSYKNYQLIFHFSKMSKMQVNIVYFGRLYMYVCAGGRRGWQTYPKSWPKKPPRKNPSCSMVGVGLQ